MKKDAFSSFAGSLESKMLSHFCFLVCFFFGIKLLGGVVWNGLNLCSMLARNYFGMQQEGLTPPAKASHGLKVCH